MLANYGYADGTGDYFIVIDTDRCDGCGECVTACPQKVLEIAPDDYGKVVARVKDEVVGRISYVCPGFNPGCSTLGVNCRSVCQPNAIDHTW